MKTTTISSKDKFFFHLSAIHPKLPLLEIISILESSKTPFSLLEEKTNCAIITCDEIVALQAGERAAHCKRVVKLLMKVKVSNKDLQQITHTISEKIDFTEHLIVGQTFRVRVYRTNNNTEEIISIDLEKKLGDIIAKQTKCKANMKKPDRTFTILFCDNELLFGLEIYERGRGYFEERRPDIRPFFKPGTLEPRFARLMVNLAQATPNELFLDPFCGPGGILVEAALIGCQVVGCDLNKKMISGAIKNIHHYSPESDSNLLVSDAKMLPFREAIGSIATDPPYGRSTSTYGKEIIDLLQQFLTQAYYLLKRGGILAIGMYHEIPIRELAEEAGFEFLSLEHIYIHRSLTRNIGVFRKT
ncbi:MAG: methyltransferase domain-containing protein [Candidatus Thorarchaeota archaeon]